MDWEEGRESYPQIGDKRGRNALELLTETLAYRGIEESLLVRDRALAASVVSHFRA